MSARWQSDSGTGVRGLLAFSTLESPAHRCRASERLTVMSNRRDQRWSSLAVGPKLPHVVSGCVMPAATFMHRSGDGGFPLVP